ncbi:MAG: MutT/NUDIX family protein [uncultured bacterium (gcode 4)]|uniref:MutT/NUDIX family protein n=1 Tax=uncultured bacterium (gcode 4) TaxID=1234023 RepID=K2FCS2_9BACT|nr:MAG: MutT/NUDIX family protein [uncultured bacterium (gcode 4)]
MILWTDCIWVGTWCMIVNAENQILLMKRSQQSKNQRWYWGLSGWTVEYWESFEEATKRETKEELDVEIKIIKLLALTDHIIKEDRQHWVSPTYLAKIVSWEIKNLEPHKCDELRWFDLDSIPELLTEPARAAIDEFKERLKLGLYFKEIFERI